jgi:hypothetical protein
MTDRKDFVSQEKRQSDLAPEIHNDEQDDHRDQAQEVAAEAQEQDRDAPSRTESRKAASPGVDNIAGNETDMIDQMRYMEDKGEIDNSAFAGEPNHDDNTKKYEGKERKG